MTKHIFIWVAHPREASLSTGLAEAYAAGARRAGAEVRIQGLWDMAFEPRMKGFGKDMPALEPDLIQWQQNIAWADHIVVIHPYWWGQMPGLARAVLDRGLTPGFAFKYHARGVKWDKLLEGRTADIVITSDTPPLLDRVFYGQPGLRVLKKQVLEFCGIKVRKALQFGSVKLAGTEKILSWKTRMEKLGASRGREAEAVTTQYETGRAA
ncbi:NAD(P)H-dependent oxidoreductase [Parvularcula marina]|uniref:NAD(P)H-dependent oxidoreductase n=1 Tax=Parvularcula marina TaxID=2292771 RepID=UPI0035116A51